MTIEIGHIRKCASEDCSITFPALADTQKLYCSWRCRRREAATRARRRLGIPERVSLADQCRKMAIGESVLLPWPHPELIGGTDGMDPGYTLSKAVRRIARETGYVLVYSGPHTARGMKVYRKA